MSPFGFGLRPFRHHRLQRLALGFHSNVAIVFEHLLRDLARDVHNRLVACSAFRQLGH